MKNQDTTLNPKQIKELFNTVCAEYSIEQKKKVSLDSFIQKSANAARGVPKLNYFIDSNLRIRVTKKHAYEWVVSLLALLLKQGRITQGTAQV